MLKVRNKEELKRICKYFDYLLSKNYDIKFDSYKAITKKACTWDKIKNINDAIKTINNNMNKTFYDIIFCFSSVKDDYNIDLYKTLHDDIFIIKNYFNNKIKISYNKKIINKYRNKKIKNKNKIYDKKISILDRIGMEIEVNHIRLDWYDYAGEYEKEDFYNTNLYEYIKEVKNENDIILEIVSKPISRNNKELLEFFDILNYDIYNSDWKLKEGENDKHAESNHTHLSFLKEKFLNIIKENPNIMLLFVPAFCRNGKFFRDAVYDSDYSIIKKLDKIPIDSKTYYLTINTEFNTLEVRGNENPFPYWIYLLESLLANYNKIDIDYYVDKIIELLELNKFSRLYNDINIKEVFNNIIDFYIELCKLSYSEECKILKKCFEEYKRVDVENYNLFIFDKFYEIYQ